jgi:hypothetical protein
MEDTDELRDIIEQRCRYCQAESAFDYIHCYEHASNDDCPEEYSLALCRACNNVSLFYREDVELIFDRFQEPAAFHYLWPSEPRYLDFMVPETVGDSYSEAVEAIKAKLPMSAAAMIGRTLEAVCKDFDSTSKTIYQGLKMMRDEGALSEELYSWANELRVLRNESAHVTDVNVTLDEVNSSMDFLQSLLEIIYKIRPKFTEYSSMRAANKAKQGGTP